jgi:transcriptional regulator with XRE-family HTH domain
MSLPLQIEDLQGFAARLRQTRQQAGLFQHDLAFEGCSAVYISRIENGQRRPNTWIAWGLAERLGVSPHWLITGKEDPLLETAQKVVAEHRSGVQIPERLINRLDRLSSPHFSPESMLRSIKSKSKSHGYAESQSSSLHRSDAFNGQMAAGQYQGIP